jgi:Uncharacterised protein family (UPF0158)
MKYSDVENAYMFVSMSPPDEHYAYLNKETGETYYVSTLGDSDELPDDLEENEKYISIPHKNDFNLGRDLVFDFISENLPDEYEQVRRMFSKKGAYARLKELLEAKGQLEAWYEFENKATEEALRGWCKENDIRLD